MGKEDDRRRGGHHMRPLCGHDTCSLRSIRHDVRMRPTMDRLHDDPVVRAARESGMSDEEKLEHRRESLKRMVKDVAALRRLKKSKQDLWQKMAQCKNAAKLNNVSERDQYESIKRARTRANVFFGLSKAVRGSDP